MNALTCILMIFLPLAFLAGIYGVSFQGIPGQGIPRAYPALWVVFLAVGSLLVFLFRKKKWL